MSDKKTIMVNGQECTVRIGAYTSNTSAMALMLDCADTHEPYATATVNLSDQPETGDVMLRDTAYLDVNAMPGIASDLQAAGLGHPFWEDEPVTRRSRFVDYPLFQFYPDKLAELDPEGFGRYQEGFDAAMDEAQAVYDAMTLDYPTDDELNDMYREYVAKGIDDLRRARDSVQSTYDYLALREAESDAQCEWCFSYISDAEREGLFEGAPNESHTIDMRRAALLDRAATLLADRQTFRDALGLDPKSDPLMNEALGLYADLGGEHPSGVSYDDMHRLAHSVIDKSCVPVPGDAELVIANLGMPTYDDVPTAGAELSYGSFKPWADCDLLHSREYAEEKALGVVREAKTRPDDYRVTACKLMRVLERSDFDANAPRVVSDVICRELAPESAFAMADAMSERLGEIVEDERLFGAVDPRHPVSETAQADFDSAFMCRAVEAGWGDRPEFEAMAKHEYKAPESLPYARRTPDVSGISDTSRQHVDTIDY